MHQRDRMVIRRMGTHRERQPMAIRNGKDHDAFTTEGFANAVTAAVGRGKRRIDEPLLLVGPLFFVSLMKSMMHGLVIGIALGQ
jgi:hypothetical protein